MLFVLITGLGCKKYLDEKPDKKLAVPKSLGDYQALLDYYPAFAGEPNSGEISSDDFYLTDVHYLSLVSDADRRTYTWEKDNLFPMESNAWSEFSTAVYYCNSVLDGLTKIERNGANQTEYDNVKGQALYFRGKRIFQAALIWSPIYRPESSGTALGMPLRLNINFNETSVRSTVRQSYDQLLEDVKKAAPLLPIKPLSKVRTSRPAAYALLSRIYLSMGDYPNSKLYADSCLQVYDKLIDYNYLDQTSSNPFPRFHDEVISENQLPSGQILNLARAKIKSEVYDSFDDPNDLRKVVLFSVNADGSHGYKARFTEGAALFGGMATNEVYLNMAECLARGNEVEKAMFYLNKLLITRWKTGAFIPYSVQNSEQALSLVLKERRKELLLRGIRWMDLKRLNADGYGISINRIINNNTYTLKPTDLRYQLPIPEDVILLSGMQQNPK